MKYIEKFLIFAGSLTNAVKDYLLNERKEEFLVFWNLLRFFINFLLGFVP
jgi:hypothetical protein